MVGDGKTIGIHESTSIGRLCRPSTYTSIKT
jgi:hypothetical protein